MKEYIIHQIEMAVKVMKQNADYAWVFHGVDQTAITLTFGEKVVTLNYSKSACGFSVDAKKNGVDFCSYRRMETDTYFYRLVRDILTFFDKEQEPFDSKQTLAVLAIRDAIVKGIDSGVRGEKLKVESI